MSHTTEQTLAEMSQIFREVLNNSSIQLRNETTAADIEEWDSLNHIELVVALEKHFKIKFNFAELQKFKNVGEMCDSIVSKIGAR